LVQIQPGENTTQQTYFYLPHVYHTTQINN
jgi:hypothetical protein